MKLLLFLVALTLVSLSSHAQTSLPDTLRYQQVVATPGVSADELYGRVREWVALTFEDVHQVVQLEDAQRHLILGSGYSRVQVRRPNGKLGASAELWLRFRIETREGRYRVEVSNLGSVYNFYSAASPGYGAYDLNRWVQSAHATQAVSQRHNALSQGFPGMSTFMTPEQVVQLKAGLDESVQSLFTSLHKTVAAPAAAW
ncbi:DUF4468 domain-containing protein [Hymenobacter sp. HMF4947]|uniref:DUF4468 domain-containing protein n=1 Tax=Hymenobacter ginkgonis TaxID=2682976 RepID=A0A7K1TLD8_9BACT|nr:DUF4468 domain-containing protein [Hymenobacter ginkgonis]MVN79237.1 DUF4468 domain-containing protein [Hymenobacter ginkgonis]